MAVELVKDSARGGDAASVATQLRLQMQERRDELSKQKHKKDILMLLSDLAESSSIVNFDANFLSTFDSTLLQAVGETRDLSASMRDM